MADRLEIDAALPGTRHTQAGGVQTRYTWQADARAVHGELLFQPEAQGLPGYVHGGALSAIADEAMGMACWCEGHCAPGAQVNVTFLQPVRAGDRGHVRAWVVSVAARKLQCEAEIRVADVVVARATGLFISVPLREPALFASWPGLERFAH
jgi:uncharacterized protein (TIGR00369 family)